MTLKPWREIARPHKDVLQGAFKQSEFAADISQVAGGAAPPEYQDPGKFFARTFITEGMRLLQNPHHAGGLSPGRQDGFGRPARRRAAGAGRSRHP